MSPYQRYAIYAAPEGALWDFASHWLGWDAARGQTLPHPHVEGLPRPLAEITETPRKYGFHATVKPPFRLAVGVSAEDLDWAADALCLRLSPVLIPGLRLARIGGFLALVSDNAPQGLSDLAARVVEALDPFRAPPEPEEITRRRPERLTPRQRAHLKDWGYPFVMDEFRFHLTLSGDLPDAEAEAVGQVLRMAVSPHLPEPFVLDSLCLCGEAADGRFHILQRYGFAN